MRALRAVRDRVLSNAQLVSGDILLDVGAGDGLVAFGALPLVGDAGRVILADISGALLERAGSVAAELGALARCTFVETPAETLDSIADASVDAVTTRSVLIYVADKAAAMRSFHRVLRPGGRVSLFEPVNRLNEQLAPGTWWGAGIPGVEDLAGRLIALYTTLQPPDSDPMLDFDERDLIRGLQSAGFDQIRLQLEVEVAPAKPAEWRHFVSVAGNPKIPSLGEAMATLFTADDQVRFEAHVRPVVEAGGRPTASAAAYVQALKRES